MGDEEFPTHSGIGILSCEQNVICPFKVGGVYDFNHKRELHQIMAC